MALSFDPNNVLATEYLALAIARDLTDAPEALADIIYSSEPTLSGARCQRLAAHVCAIHNRVYTPPPYDYVSAIIAYESGDLDDDDTLTLFAYLIETGLAWTLQGSYGRAAAHLIESGILSPDGEILPE